MPAYWFSDRGRRNEATEYMVGVLQREGPSMLVPWYLMLSYLYYINDISLVHDSAFDGLGADLLRYYGQVEHRHKSLVDPEALAAGTAYHIKEREYPGICQAAAGALCIKFGFVVEVPSGRTRRPAKRRRRGAGKSGLPRVPQAEKPDEVRRWHSGMLH